MDCILCALSTTCDTRFCTPHHLPHPFHVVFVVALVVVLGHPHHHHHPCDVCRESNTDQQLLCWDTSRLLSAVSYVSPSRRVAGQEEDKTWSSSSSVCQYYREIGETFCFPFSITQSSSSVALAAPSAPTSSCFLFGKPVCLGVLPACQPAVLV